MMRMNKAFREGGGGCSQTSFSPSMFTGSMDKRVARSNSTWTNLQITSITLEDSVAGLMSRASSILLMRSKYSLNPLLVTETYVVKSQSPFVRWVYSSFEYDAATKSEWRDGDY